MLARLPCLHAATRHIPGRTCLRLSQPVFAYRSLPQLRHSATSSSAAAPAGCPGAAPEPVVDGMPRYPGLCPGGVLRALDYGGTAVFAFTGAHTAAAHGLDLLGVLLVGTVTAVGGGTLRDLVVFARPPFWSGAEGEAEYLYISLAAAAAAFFCLPELRRRGALHEDGALLQWGDALGLGAFAVIGAQNGLRARLPPLLCLLCGVSTATFGGLTRDVLVAREGGARILHSHAELYASCAGAGAGAYLAAAALRAPLWARVGAGVGVGVAARAAAWQQGLRLPTWSTLGGGAAELVLPSRRPAASAQ